MDSFLTLPGACPNLSLMPTEPHSLHARARAATAEVSARSRVLGHERWRWLRLGVASEWGEGSPNYGW